MSNDAKLAGRIATMVHAFPAGDSRRDDVRKLAEEAEALERVTQERDAWKAACERAREVEYALQGAEQRAREEQREADWRIVDRWFASSPSPNQHPGQLIRSTLLTTTPLRDLLVRCEAWIHASDDGEAAATALLADLRTVLGGGE